ncbi:hypothetical protein [Rhizobium tubonense]|uniref:Uncharacterized protein n=1 Tax=Rhizobium tubonense TaxID=484088 RepID=A0A2W4D530_9HYPH|nr:hypothetical protein [Rhizobium tubonense]PZM17155.1 hypothetical protein CPY51_02705 [Rhizobium tubonense]
MHGRNIAVAVGLALLSAATTAGASSDEAWKQFARDVELKCTEAVGEQIAHPLVVVDPTGSEHYGLALVSGIPKGSKAKVTVICVYDKQQKKAEIGSQLGSDKVRLPPLAHLPIKAK